MTPHSKTHFRRPWRLALRTLAVLLAATALAQPTVRRSGAGQWLVLTDASASARGQATGDSLPASVPHRAYRFAETIRDGNDRTDPPMRTLLAPALRLAAAREVAGVVVRTDGQFQDAADWPAAATALERLRRPALIVPMESPPADARVAGFSAYRLPDGRVELEIHVAANAAQQRVLSVFGQDADRPLIRKPLALTSHQPLTCRLVDQPPDDRAIVYRCRLSAADAFAENDHASAVVLPRQGRVALIGSSRDRAEWMQRELRQPVEVTPPALAPRDAMGYLPYAAVVLEDPAPSVLDAAQRHALADYVCAGGGLALLGTGPYGSPADADDPLNRVAALTPDPQDRQPLRVTVVLDASGSMAQPSADGQTRFQLAASAVAALKQHLTPRDALAVLTFSDRPATLYDSGEASVDFAALRAALQRVQPAGPTHLATALEAVVKPAVSSADGQREKRPHPLPPRRLTLIVSDLGVEAFDAAAMARAFGERNIAAAIVAIGGDEVAANPSLEQFARHAGAPLVRRENLAALADIFKQFIADQRPAVRRGRFTLSLPPPDGRLSPPLASYVLCRSAEGSDVLGRVGDDPVLASRRVGGGEVRQLAAPMGTDNLPLQQSEFFRRWLPSAVRAVSRLEADSRFAGAVEVNDDEWVLTLTARQDGQPMNGLTLTADLTPLANGGQAAPPTQWPLLQTAPGVYRAAGPRGDQPILIGVYWEGKAGMPARAMVWRQALPHAAPPELARIGPDWDALNRLAKLTGGKIVTERELPRAVQQADAAGRVPLWPLLAALALVAAIIDWLFGKKR